MLKSKPLRLPMMLLAMTLTLGACETVRSVVQDAGLCPAPQVIIRPSTFCQSYVPIEARADDPAAARGTDAFNAWWDALPGKIGQVNDERVRGNNGAYQANCL